MPQRHAQKEKTASVQLPAWRALLLFGVLLLMFAGMFGRAVYLQGFHDDFLQEKGRARYSRVLEVNAHRGMITDRAGAALAISTPVESVWASPPEVEAEAGQVRELAKILDMNVETLKNKLFDTSRDFVYLKRQLPPDQAERVVRLGVPGVSLQREYRRYYPTGEEAAQLVGFTSVDDSGQEGLELAFQSRLAGHAGSQRVIKDRRGHIVEAAGSLNPPKPGEDILLSLDGKLQHLVYRELSKAVTEHKARAGAAVVLDAQSGEVLALANYPAYNPNNRKRVDPQAMRNRALADIFEPGSTMKPFTVASVLERGKVSAGSRINTENGTFVVGNRKIHDTHPEPSLSVAQVIQKSSNIGAAKMALMLEPQQMWQNLTDCGFGAATGSGFPGEAAGILHEPSRWREIDQATISYGHGISVNLLQLVRGYTVFANDGVLMPISLTRQETPATGQRVYSAATARAVLGMMETVTQLGGTAPEAQVAGYRVAGKTGTAHKLENGRYVQKYVASFVGVAPVSHPRLIIGVMVDEPTSGGHYGGQVAAPVFSRITAAALPELGVPHDAPLDNVIAPGGDVIREDV